MSLVFDILVDFFFQLFGEGFLLLYSAFVPQKGITEKRRFIIGCMCFAVSLLLLVGFFVGIILMIEKRGESFLGWLLVSLSIIYLIAGITVKIVSYIKNRKSVSNK